MLLADDAPDAIRDRCRFDLRARNEFVRISSFSMWRQDAIRVSPATTGPQTRLAHIPWSADSYNGPTESTGPVSSQIVVVDALTKVYSPTPRWMRVLVRSPSKVPVTALAGVTITVDRGQLCAVIGPNGAGKSTLFRILTGLTTPTGGRVSLLGMDPVVDGHRLRRHIGFMPAEDRTLFLRHTSRENLRFHGRLQGLDEATLKRRIDEVLETVGLWDARSRAGFALSSGMRARLLLARAILNEPRVLILDEPTSAIDPISAHDFLELIIKITVERGTATLVSSHRLEEIDTLRDNVLLLDQGRAVFTGNLDHVRAVADHKVYQVECVDPAAAQLVADTVRSKIRGLADISIENSHVLFPAPAGTKLDLNWLVAIGGHVKGVSLRTLSLRETIKALLAEGSER